MSANGVGLSISSPAPTSPAADVLPTNPSGSGELPSGDDGGGSLGDVADGGSDNPSGTGEDTGGGTDGADNAGDTAGAGASSGGGGGAGNLPFTGFPAAVAGALGGLMASTGTALRYATRRR